jgi:thiol-disulfide isomerase/thioredoxin
VTRSTQALILSIAAVAFLASLFVFPLQPFSRDVMAALDATGATIENWEVERLELLDAAGQPVSMASYDGHLVYLTYWAEWCSVCKDEMPSLDALARANTGRVEVLTATIDEDPTASFEFLRGQFPQGPNFGVLVDPGGRMASQFGTTGVPETFLIDGEGTVIARYIGPHNFLSPAHQRLRNLLVSR